jgi:3-dehydrosphinganine reductase
MSVPFLLHYPDNLTNVDDQVAAPIWRRTIDKRVIAHREEHEEYLKTIGFFGSN